MAATVAAMAANDTALAVETNTENEPKGSMPAASAEPELTLAPDTPASSQPVPAPPKPAQAAPSPAATPAATATPPVPRRPIPGNTEIDASAARRLEMVRSLNKKRPPMVNAPAAEDIVLGDADPVPGGTEPKPEPIENQFGTSMTANLKALSMQSVEAMQKAEEEEKKGGLLSRFKRS